MLLKYKLYGLEDVRIFCHSLVEEEFLNHIIQEE